MTDYDSWLLRQADEYMRDCEPETDRDGEYTKCINCFDKCNAYYEIFPKEPELDEDWKPFIDATNARLK